MKAVLLLVTAIFFYTHAQAYSDEVGASQSDQAIKQKLEKELSETFENTDAKLSLHVKDGFVIVEGLVESGTQLYVIETALKHSKEIKGFENRAGVR